jgi:hypothetical protein
MLQPRVTWVACGQKRKQVANSDDKIKGLEIKGICTINNEYFWKNVQIQKRVPQCEMSAPRRAEISWKTNEGWGPH